MTQNKTRPTNEPVKAFIDAVEPERRRAEAAEVVDFITRVANVAPMMWGTSIVGWGTMRYRYASGREDDWMKVGFSPRKAQLTFYGLQDAPQADEILAGLGYHSLGKGCVYVKHWDDIDRQRMTELVRGAMERGDYDLSR